MIGIQIQEISLVENTDFSGIQMQEISLYDEDITGISLKGFTIEQPKPKVEPKSKSKPKQKPNIKKTKKKDVKISEYIKGEVDKKYLEDVQKTLSDLPYIKEYMEKNKWQIICRKERVNGSNSGMIDYKEKVIELCATDNISDYFVHECGHLLDFMLQYTLNNKDFSKLYQKELDKVLAIQGVEQVNTRNEREYFAECFRLYIEKNDSFKELKSYKLMKGIIENEEK